MTVLLDDLKEVFKVQLERGVTNLFFFTQEQHPRDADDWRCRAFPSNQMEDLLPYLQDYTYYRTTNHLPRFFKS